MPQIDYFKHVKDAVSYNAGEIIFKVGDPDDLLYAVQEGEVDIYFNGAVIETVSVGGIMGEKSIIDDSPHTTTAIARTDCKIVKVDEQRFLFLVQETPTFATQVMRVMARRTREMMLRAIGQEPIKEAPTV